MRQGQRNATAQTLRAIDDHCGVPPADASAAVLAQLGVFTASDSNVDMLVDEPQQLGLSGLSRTERHRRSKAGIFPPPILMGSRCSRRSLREIVAWQRAIKAGKNEDEIRNLVKQLVAARSK